MYREKKIKKYDAEEQREALDGYEKSKEMLLRERERCS
jgi:hypothetical protein